MSFLNPQAFQPIRRRLLYPLVSNGKGRRLMATIDALNGTTSVEQKKGLLDFKTLHELQRVACDVSVYVYFMPANHIARRELDVFYASVLLNWYLYSLFYRIIIHEKRPIRRTLCTALITNQLLDLSI